MRHMSYKSEIGVRIFLVAFFFYTDHYPGFIRKIQPEEYWLYNFPRTQDYYPSRYLWVTVFATPVVTAAIVHFFTQNIVDTVQFLMGAVMSIFLAGDITNCVKMGVGRPRPDFLARCFPDGNIKDNMECTGDPAAVADGYKSFPSGHSALSFSCLGYIALYIAGKLHVCNAKGRGNGWGIVLVILPVLWATMIAVSRTADYHHHWQDVTVGSILGMVVAYAIYRSYFPALQRHNSHLPYCQLTPVDTAISYSDHPISPDHLHTMPKLDEILKNV